MNKVESASVVKTLNSYSTTTLTHHLKMLSIRMLSCLSNARPPWKHFTFRRARPSLALPRCLQPQSNKDPTPFLRIDVDSNIEENHMSCHSSTLNSKSTTSSMQAGATVDNRRMEIPSGRMTRKGATALVSRLSDFGGRES